MTKQASLAARIKKRAVELGFCLVGIARAEELADEKQRLQQWLALGYHGNMQYMENYFAKRTDPRELVPGAKSVICTAMNYCNEHSPPTQPDSAKISRYAWGDDYHYVVKDRLRDLFVYIQELVPEVQGRVFVDSAPVMEKAWAVKSGVGWLGKHGNVIHREYGSWFFLGEVIVDIELLYDRPIADFCGSCNRCIEACPTDAIREPYVVDANRCISYLTIELKPQHNIPPAFHDKLDNWIFGCDICQDVCPWNIKFAQIGDEPRFLPREGILSLTLKKAAAMDREEFNQRFRKSPVKRPKWQGFIRNALAALTGYLQRER